MTTLFDQGESRPSRPVGLPDAPSVPHARTVTSAEAAQRLRETGEAATLQAMVLTELHRSGHEGLTARELADRLTRIRGRRTEQCSVTGRLNPCPRLGEPIYAFAVPTARTRDGAMVWVHRIHAEGCGECRLSISVWEQELHQRAVRRHQLREASHG